MIGLPKYKQILFGEKKKKKLYILTCSPVILLILSVFNAAEPKVSGLFRKRLVEISGVMYMFFSACFPYRVLLNSAW